MTLAAIRTASRCFISLRQLSMWSRENAEARRRAQIDDAERHLEAHIASLSRTSGIDFSKFDLDEPLPALTSNGHQTLVAQYAGRTLREISGTGKMLSDINLVGTASDVANRLAEIIDEGRWRWLSRDGS